MKKILIIGDSVRKGYSKYVKIAFQDVAEVYYPDDNCRFSAYVVRHLGDWKKILGLGDDVDLVHWNAGLWDDLVIQDGEHHTPIEIYKYYIERTCKIIKILFPRAKMIFATSTPVQEELFTGVYKRCNKDTEDYNAAAVEIVRRYGGEINDLYALMNAAPVEYHSDSTHYYTKEGTRIMTNQVIDHMERCLDIKGKRLDYDEIFAEKENVIGI